MVHGAWTPCTARSRSVRAEVCGGPGAAFGRWSPRLENIEGERMMEVARKMETEDLGGWSSFCLPAAMQLQVQVQVQTNVLTF